MGFLRAIVFHFAIILSIGLLFSSFAHPTLQEASGTAIAVRPTGEVGEHFDPRDIVERAIWGKVTFLFKSLFTLAAARVVCTSTAAAGVVGAVGCVALAAVSVMYTLGFQFQRGGAQTEARRDLIDAGLARWLDHHEPHYPSTGELSGIEELMQTYNGTAIRVTTCTRPDVPHCKDVHYQNFAHPNGRLIHHLRATPASHRKEMKRDYEGTTPEDDGGEYVADYYFATGIAADEVALGDDMSDGGLAQHWSDAFMAQNDPDPQEAGGVFCTNFIDGCDEAAVGFISASPVAESEFDHDTIYADFDACKQFSDDYVNQNC